MPVREITRYLRKRQTPAEKVFWDAVRNRKLENKKFLRQYPVVFEYNNAKRFFIADFYCAEHRLVVEIDGKIHERQADYDRMREWVINELGYTVVRFRNEDVIGGVDDVLRVVRERFLLTPRPAERFSDLLSTLGTATSCREPLYE